MKKLTKKEIQAEIKRRNKLFKNATKPQKRVLIAKDVIQQINLGRIIPKSMSWVDFDSSFKQGSVRDHLLGKEECKACALGGIFASCTLFNNETTFEKDRDFLEDLGFSIFDYNKKPKNGMMSIFSKSQLKLIEFAFEEGDGWCLVTDACDPAKSELSAIDFGKKFSNSKDRMVAIMENIIKNNGLFKP